MAIATDQIEGAEGAPAGAMPLRTGRRRTFLLAGLYIFLVWVIAGLVIWQNQRNAIDDWKRNAVNSSLTVAAYLKQAFGAADLVAKSIQDWIGDEEISSETEFRKVMQERRFFDAMRDRVVGQPQIGLVGIIGSNGELLNNIHAHPAAPLDLSDREAYTASMATGAPVLVLTAPSPSRSNGRWTFYLVRRVTSASGETLGLVTVGLDVEFLTAFFRSISIGEDSWLSLFREDGTLLATSVPQPDVLGKRYADSLPRRLIGEGRSGEAVFADGPSWFDLATPRPRIVAPRRIDGYPVFVSLVIGESVFLARWRETSLVVLVLAAALTLAGLFVAWQVLWLIDRSAAASRTEAQRRLLAVVVDTPSAFTAVLDRGGRVLHANARFREVFGGEADIYAALKKFDLASEEAVRAFVTGNAKLGEFDLAIERQGSPNRMLHFTMARRTLPDSGDCTVMFGHDETIRLQARRAIALSAKMVTLGEVTTGIAHELSQPLNVIRMAAQNALTEIEPAAGGAEGDAPVAPLPEAELRGFVAGKLHRVIAQVDRAAAILARMRVFSRETRQGPQPFDVREACRGALALSAPRLRREAVAVREDLGDEPLVVVGHRTRFEQGLLNLLMNAADALHDGPLAGRQVEVRARRSTSGGIEVEISDSGPGVPIEVRDRIFEPFFTTKPVGQGTGLGLASTFGIVRDSGGALTLLDVGPGATFRIELPAASPASSSPEAAAIPA